MKKSTFQLLAFPNIGKAKTILDFYQSHGVLINLDRYGTKWKLEATADIATLCNLANSLGRENVLCVCTGIEDVTARPLTLGQWVNPADLITSKIKAQATGRALV